MASLKKRIEAKVASTLIVPPISVSVTVPATAYRGGSDGGAMGDLVTCLNGTRRAG